MREGALAGRPDATDWATKLCRARRWRAGYASQVRALSIQVLWTGSFEDSKRWGKGSPPVPARRNFAGFVVHPTVPAGRTRVCLGQDTVILLLGAYNI